MQNSGDSAYRHCLLCPRRCGTDRTRGPGFCGCTDHLSAARAALHFWEEPCLSGAGPDRPGSGAVFFSGCPLQCCFCQNDRISRGRFGKEIGADRLTEIFFELQAKGAANINLVTATQYWPTVLAALQAAGSRLKIPAVWNCGGYETADSVEALSQNIPIFLPDIKYFDPALSARFAHAPDYFDKASEALLEMVRRTGRPEFDRSGLLRRGVIVRHLVLPGHRDDSIRILRWLADHLPRDGFILSLMSQYTPYRELPYRELNRRVSSFEYGEVVREALRLGLDRGYSQERTAARQEYTPLFDLTGI